MKRIKSKYLKELHLKINKTSVQIIELPFWHQCDEFRSILQIVLDKWSKISKSCLSKIAIYCACTQSGSPEE